MPSYDLSRHDGLQIGPDITVRVTSVNGRNGDRRGEVRLRVDLPDGVRVTPLKRAAVEPMIVDRPHHAGPLNDRTAP